MRKSVVIVVLACIIAMLIGGIGGFIIASYTTADQGINSEYETQNDLVGTYRTNSWNGKEAVLVLKEDGTCIHPAGDSGTWAFKDNTLYLNIDSRYYIDSELIEESREIKPLIVPGGVMLSGHFFEKIK